MTAREAKAMQDGLAAKGMKLGWWYGVKCEPCCGVFPKLMKKAGFDPNDAYYQCEVCGKRTDAYTMPWLAEAAWNRHEYQEQQMSLFGGVPE